MSRNDKLCQKPEKAFLLNKRKSALQKKKKKVQHERSNEQLKRKGITLSTDI